MFFYLIDFFLYFYLVNDYLIYNFSLTDKPLCGVPLGQRMWENWPRISWKSTSSLTLGHFSWVQITTFCKLLMSVMKMKRNLSKIKSNELSFLCPYKKHASSYRFLVELGTKFNIDINILGWPNYWKKSCKKRKTRP